MALQVWGAQLGGCRVPPQAWVEPPTLGLRDGVLQKDKRHLGAGHSGERAQQTEPLPGGCEHWAPVGSLTGTSAVLAVAASSPPSHTHKGGQPQRRLWIKAYFDFPPVGIAGEVWVEDPTTSQGIFHRHYGLV